MSDARKRSEAAQQSIQRADEEIRALPFIATRVKTQGRLPYWSVWFGEYSVQVNYSVGEGWRVAAHVKWFHRKAYESVADLVIEALITRIRKAQDEADRVSLACANDIRQLRHLQEQVLQAGKVQAA